MTQETCSRRLNQLPKSAMRKSHFDLFISLWSLYTGPSPFKVPLKHSPQHHWCLTSTVTLPVSRYSTAAGGHRPAEVSGRLILSSQSFQVFERISKCLTRVWLCQETTLQDTQWGLYECLPSWPGCVAKFNSKFFFWGWMKGSTFSAVVTWLWSLLIWSR